MTLVHASCAAATLLPAMDTMMTYEERFRRLLGPFEPSAPSNSTQGGREAARAQIVAALYEWVTTSIEKVVSRHVSSPPTSIGVLAELFGAINHAHTALTAASTMKTSLHGGTVLPGDLKLYTDPILFRDIHDSVDAVPLYNVFSTITCPMAGVEIPDRRGNKESVSFVNVFEYFWNPVSVYAITNALVAMSMCLERVRLLASAK